jgi:hypothetical protein
VLIVAGVHVHTNDVNLLAAPVDEEEEEEAVTP